VPALPSVGTGPLAALLDEFAAGLALRLVPAAPCR